MKAARTLPLSPTARRQRILVTPEGIGLPLTLATRASRAGALIIDFLIVIGGLIGFQLML